MFRRMVHNYLNTRPEANPSLVAVAISSGASGHLNEDELTAFVEGRLSEREAVPFVAHLVACTNCRRISARLVRLQSEVEDQTLAPSVSEEPGRVRRLLDDLASRLTFVSGEESVFAYHAPAEDFDDAHREAEAKKTESQTGTTATGQNSSPEETQK